MIYDKDNLEVVSPVAEEENDIVNNISTISSQEEFKEIISLFNLNQGKKNALRISKLNKLLDDIEDQAIERFKKDPNKMSNSDLLDYFKAVQEAIDRSNKYVNEVENKPMIQVNQQNITINTDNDGLDRDSRERVIETIRAILNSSENKEADEVIDITEGDNDDNN